MVVSKVEINQKSTELVGVLQAISIVAKNLSQRLVKIEEEVNMREEAMERRSKS